MTGRGIGRRQSPTGSKGASRLFRAPRWLVAAAVAVVGLGASAAIAGADGSVTLPGAPLEVSVGSLGECQSSYPNVGTNFYPPSSTVGDCGFFLAFPTSGSEQPNSLKGTVFGFSGTAGPGVPSDGEGAEYTFIEQGAATGSGTSADPYKEITKYKVSAGGKDYAVITDTTTYVNGEPQFTSTYTVENTTGKGGTNAPPAPLYFHAIVAGDLFVADDDHGTGVFLGGPPKFIGGQNPHTGTLGGFIEATPAWTNYQEGYWNGPDVFETEFAEDHGIWNAVRTAAGASTVFNDTIDPSLIDNGAGVSWDEHLTSGLKAGESASYSIVNRSQIPTALGVQPVTQSHTVGQTATITVTATDNVGTPYAGRSLVYSIGGANPKSGSVTTNSAGVATISYVGTNAGLDTMQMFLDLAGTGSQTGLDPSSAAQITWTPAPPTPNSTYTIQSIHANPNGTVTITFVPTQAGAATVVVTVPTASIASRGAVAATSKRCKKGQIKIKGKCRPKTTVSGKTTGKGTAGVPLKLTVKPSSKLKAKLAQGKTVHLTATLTYKSSLGGAPTVKTFHITVKGKKPKHKK